MSQVGNNIYPNTIFPDAVQELPTFTDLSTADQTNYIKYLQQVLAGNISAANTYLNLITNTAIINANKLNILSDTIGAIQDVFQTSASYEAIINEKQAEWQKIINQFSYVGEWIEPITYDPSSAYDFGDIVIYNNKIWLCKLNNTTSTYLPGENNNWTQYYLKNTMVSYYDVNSDRDMVYVAIQNVTETAPPSQLSSQWLCLTIKGVPGLNGDGFNFQGGWDSTITYGEHNLVEYNGNAYSSKVGNNLNHLPTDTNYWQQEFATSMSQIPIQASAPLNQNVGDLWFQLLS